MTFYIGLISGTSADAIDAALVSFKNSSVDLIHYTETQLPDKVQQTLADLRVPNAPITLKQLTQLHHSLGQLFAQASTDLIKAAQIKKEEIIAIGSHGQTLFHSPSSSHPFSLQLGDPNTIAATSGITTISDFRNMDIAFGGQGAPLVAGFHNFIFHSVSTTRVILNLGGIANITLLPADPDLAISGFDTGPANALMDEWIALHRNEKYDHNGQWGRTGVTLTDLLSELIADEYFQLPAPKSTGREYFNLHWLNKKLSGRSVAAEDVQATLQRLTVHSISNAIQQINLNVAELIVCGGGVHNQTLLDLLVENLPELKVHSSDQFGLDPDCIEAVAFAWLAKQRMENLPGNIPTVTGAKRATQLGAIYSL